MSSTRGILRPRAGLEHFHLQRDEPPDDLRTFVDRLWTVAWDLPAGQRFTQEILPFPNVNLAFDGGEMRVHGPTKARFVRVLEGRGWACGVRFRPAGFFAVTCRPMREIAEHVLLAEDATGVVAPACPSDPKEAKATLLDYVRSCLRDVDRKEIERINDWVERAQEDRGIATTRHLAELAGLSIRSVHRALEKHVGVGSKWIVRRARVQECAEFVAQGQSVDWARVAQDLGYHDQAHLIRDFKLQMGVTPSVYAEQCRG